MYVAKYIAKETDIGLETENWHKKQNTRQKWQGEL